MKSPILFLIFNRPDTTEKVFAAIKNVKPSRLYVAADGPRAGNTSDSVLCEQTRNVIRSVDWDCQIYTLFREENLGCKKAVSTAISWFFENEERGIVLEDDCLPDPTFFSFCDIMLDRYENDHRVSHISGSNFQNGVKYGDGDYYYSNLTHVWGWAGWRRGWNLYDVNMTLWPQFKLLNYLAYIFPNKNVTLFLESIFDKVYNGQINTWDYQLFFSYLINRKLSIIPNKNLISNIGYGIDATHTTTVNNHANMPTTPITSFNPPSLFIPSFQADINTLKSSAPYVLKLKLKKLLEKNIFFKLNRRKSS